MHNEIFKKSIEANIVMNREQKDNLKKNKLYTKLMKELNNYYSYRNNNISMTTIKEMILTQMLKNYYHNNNLNKN